MILAKPYTASIVNVTLVLDKVEIILIDRYISGIATTAISANFKDSWLCHPGHYEFVVIDAPDMICQKKFVIKSM